MAKAEAAVMEQDEAPFDQEALLEEDLADIPEEQELHGLWVVQWIGAKVKAGHGEKGPWSMINISLDPVTPAGEDAEEILSDYDLTDLPRVYHRVFYTTNRDKRAFVALAATFGVEAGSLRDMLEALKGQEAVAKLSPGKDNFGRSETKLSAFRSAE